MEKYIGYHNPYRIIWPLGKGIDISDFCSTLILVSGKKIFICFVNEL